MNVGLFESIKSGKKLCNRSTENIAVKTVLGEVYVGKGVKQAGIMAKHFAKP